MFNILQVCTYTCIHTDAERHKCTHNMHALPYAYMFHHLILYTRLNLHMHILHIKSCIFSEGNAIRIRLYLQYLWWFFRYLTTAVFPFLVCLRKLTEILLWTATHSTISTIFWTFRKSVFEVVFLVSFVLICFSQSIYFSRNPKAQTNDLSTLRWTSLFLP